MHERSGIRIRLTMLYGIAMTLTTFFLCSGIYYFIQRALMEQVENHLRKDSVTIKEYLKSDINSLSKVANHGPIQLFQVYAGATPLISSDHWKEESLENVVSSITVSNLPLTINSVSGRPYRVLIDRVEAGGNQYKIIVAHSEEGVQQTKSSLTGILLLTLPVAISLSLFIGYFLAGRVLAPIAAITRKAHEITAENLSERLPVGNSDDEFSRLATVFNQAFARIEDSFYRLKRFTSDASHEMRTPLAAIRSIGEAALHSSNTQNNPKEAIESILEENDRLRQMIDSLLLLSRADSGETSINLEPVNIVELVKETVELLNILADEKQQSILIAGDSTVAISIDAVTMKQAIINLLDNAIKYSPRGSIITINMGETEAGEPFIAIIDSGIGIPENDLDKIFDRFYRVDKGRSRETGGTGLGLAIAKWAVGCSNAKIEASSKLNEGSEFRIIFSSNKF